jgi:C_GCAxxG_C_C family probable redox protein
LQEKMHVGSPEIFKAGSALAGGVARRGETCGALTGAIMAVCSIVGREKLEDREQYGAAMEEAGRIFDRFTEAIGHSLCSEIHKKRYGKFYRLNIPEERTAFHEMGGHSRTGCPEVCGIAARIAAEAILDLKEKGKPAKSP